MIKCEMSKLESKAIITAVGTTEDLLTELAGLVSEITREMLAPCPNSQELLTFKQVIIGCMIGGVEYGADKVRKEMEAKQNGSTG